MADQHRQDERVGVRGECERVIHFPDRRKQNRNAPLPLIPLGRSVVSLYAEKPIERHSCGRLGRWWPAAIGGGRLQPQEGEVDGKSTHLGGGSPRRGRHRSRRSPSIGARRTTTRHRMTSSSRRTVTTRHSSRDSVPSNFPDCFIEYADLLTWDKKWDEVLDTSEPAVLQVVRRGQTQCVRQLRRPASGVARRQERDHLGAGGRGRRDRSTSRTQSCIVA